MRRFAAARGTEVGGLVLAVAAFFWRPLTTETFYFRDIYLLFYGKKKFLVDALRSGVLPLWDPLTNGGQPYLAEPANGTFYPGNILFGFLSALTGLNVLIVLQFALCAIAAWWLGRTAGLSRRGAFLAGFVYAFAGYTLSTANLLPLLLGFPWVPMSIACAHRALRDRSRPALVAAAACIALPLLGGAAELTAMAVVLLAVWIAAQPAAVGSRRWKAIVVAVAVAGGAILSLIQTVPAAEVVAHSERSAGVSYETFSQSSLDPRRLAELVVPGMFGPTSGASVDSYWGRALEGNREPYILSIYFGVLALTLAVVGAFGRRSSRSTVAGSPAAADRPDEIPGVPLLVTAAAFACLALGSNLPIFRWIYDHVPLVTTFRYPIKALMAAVLPVAILSGRGIDVLARADARLLRRVAALLGGFALVALLVARGMSSGLGFSAAFARLFFLRPPDARMVVGVSGSLTHAALLAAAGAAAALGMWKGHRISATLLVATVAVDLAIAGAPVNVYAPRTLYDPSPLVPVVRTLAGDGRFYHALDEQKHAYRAPTDDAVWQAWWHIQTLRFYTAQIYGIPVTLHQDYDALAPAREAHLVVAMLDLPWNRRAAVMTLAGVRTFIANARIDVPSVTTIARLPAIEKDPPYLYAISGAAPARFFSSIAWAQSDREELGAVTRGLPPDVLLLHGRGVPVRGCGTAAVAIEARSLNSVRYRVDAPCDGYVFFSETHYPGWRASVDGAPAALERADYAFSAVAVKRGRHTIVREYRPRLPLVGAIASLLGIVALIAISGPATRWGARESAQS